MNYKNKILTPGLAYCEIIGVDDLGKDGLPLKSRNGELMLRLKLKVVDSKGEFTNIWDYMVINAEWKIQNIQNAFRVNNLAENGSFNKAVLLHKCAAAAIKTESTEQYGEATRIETYVPLEFLKMASVNSNVIPPTTQSKPTLLDDDDDIPF